MSYQRIYRAAAFTLTVGGLAACTAPWAGATRTDLTSAHDCTAAHAFDAGRRGASYRSACSGAPDTAVRAAYRDGHTLFVTASDIQKLEATRARRAEHLRDVQQELRRAFDSLVAPDSSTSDRLWLIERTKQLSTEQGRLQEEVATLDEELAAKRRDAAALRDASREALAHTGE